MVGKKKLMEKNLARRGKREIREDQFPWTGIFSLTYDLRIGGVCFERAKKRWRASK